KYGCSDARFNNLGGMHLLFWRSIEEAKKDGLRTFDLGRSGREGAGLNVFKVHTVGAFAGQLQNDWGLDTADRKTGVFTRPGQDRRCGGSDVVQAHRIRLAMLGMFKRSLLKLAHTRRKAPI